MKEHVPCWRNKTKKMDIVQRLPTTVGLYDVVKYLDPRLLQIQFYKNENMFANRDIFSYSPRYVEGHDISGNLIYNLIKKNGKMFYLLLSQIRKRNGKHRYYLTFVESEMQQYSSIYSGNDMGSAVFQYLEEVSTYGVKNKAYFS